MPFKSKAQMRWMFANDPEMAKRWAKHTPNIDKLPERVDSHKEKDHEKESGDLTFVNVIEAYKARVNNDNKIKEKTAFDSHIIRNLKNTYKLNNKEVETLLEVVKESKDNKLYHDLLLKLID